MYLPLPSFHGRRQVARRLRSSVAALGAALLIAAAIIVAAHPPQSHAARGSAHAAKHKKKHRRRVNHNGHYLSLARQGIYNSYRNWWNPGKQWFNDRMNDTDQYPLGTIWTLFPLWEALSGVAIAQPTSAHRNEVAWFANTAETYFNSLMQGYGPYPGSHTRDEIWFDDNAWWGLGFVDAYRATRDRRYLDDAARGIQFLNSYGWDRKHHRMRWSTAVQNQGSNLETLGGATALAGELYEYTGNKTYRNIARKYIRWADKKGTRRHRGKSLYESRDEPALSYVEGTFIAGHLALCRKGDHRACRRAWSLGAKAYKHWRHRDPFYNPPADSILFRYVLQLAGDKRALRLSREVHPYTTPRQLYEWARRAAEDALNNARVHGLFIKFWDGTAASKHHDGYRSYRYGQLMTHAAPVALLAWLGVVHRPKH